MASALPLIDIERVQLGMYVVLDLGWMNHPFLRDRFTLRTPEQLDQLRGLGLRRVRWCPERSLTEPLPESSNDPELVVDTPAEASGAPMQIATAARFLDGAVPTATQWQEATLRHAEAQFSDAAQQHQVLLKQLAADPGAARASAEQLGEALYTAIADCPNPAVRLLSQRVGQQASGHEVCITALALLLARDAGFGAEAQRELALAALLHDIGKTRLPRFLHEDNGRLTESERRNYRRHVELGIELAHTLELPASVLQTIAQHHEHLDGSGFPAGIGAAALSPSGRVLAIVNRYHNLLTPPHPHIGLTPYQALQQMYGSERARYDETLLARFIRILGVYPPGTLVELSDRRFAIVIAAQPGKALAPRVQVIESPDDDVLAPAIDIDPDGELRVRGSLNPAQLSPKWAHRSRQWARNAVFVEAQTSPEWAPWQADRMLEAVDF